MGIKTKTFRIESAVITKQYLLDLGEIVEEQCRKIDEVLEVEVTKILEADPNKEQYHIDHVRSMNQPNHSISYRIVTADEVIPFSSIEKFLEIKELPNKIKYIDINIYHRNNIEGVNIDIKFNAKGNSEEVRLVSGNEKELLYIEEKLKKFFHNNKTGYAFLINKHYEAEVILVSFLLYIFVYLALIINLVNNFPALIYNDLLLYLFAYILAYPFIYLLIRFIKFILPIYIIDLNGKQEKNRKKIWSLVAFILVTFIIPITPNIYNKIIINKPQQKNYQADLNIKPINQIDSEKNIFELTGNLYGFVSVYSLDNVIKNPYNNTRPDSNKTNPDYYEVQKINNELFIIAYINDDNLNSAKANKNINRIIVTIAPYKSNLFKNAVALPARRADFIAQRSIEIDKKKIEVIDIKIREIYFENIISHN